MFKLLPTSGFKWLDPKKFNLNKYTSNSSKGYVLEFDFQYPMGITKITQLLSIRPR